MPRLTVLNSCESASQANHSDMFAGIASTLVFRGIPAVVAMQYEISDDAAVTFAQTFYSTLAKNWHDAEYANSVVVVEAMKPAT